MAESVVGFLIKQLSTLLSQESTLLGGFRPDVQYIKDELGSMKAFLRQAEAKEDNDSQLQEWVKQVREVAYDTEDVLDDFAFFFARGHADGFVGHVEKIYNSTKNLKARHRICLEIKDIKARVVEISARHQRYQSLYVVSVVGMGGLGKTTVVKKVYDDAIVKKQFQSHAWITVSQNFHFNVIIKDLIQQLDFLKERRYILVLDDVWSLDAWEAIKYSNGCPLNLEEDRIDEWEMILHGFSGEVDGSGKLERIRRILLLSYNDLPHHLKSCLLYLSIYPEDYPIRNFLKVLNLAGAEMDNIPKEVFKLFHLTFLDLSGTRVKVIPKSIGQLQNLEVLILAGTTITELPVEILKLRKLCVLIIGRVEEETLDLQHSISPKLGFLARLWLNGRLERVPEWIISLQSLSTLVLLNSELSEDENAIGCLGHLPNLVELTLHGAYEGETLCFKAGRFQKLQRLELMQLKRLKWVRVEEESMSSLQQFFIIGCKLMEGLPLGLQNLTGLKLLGLLDMSDELINKVQNLDKQSDDYQTISRFPEVCTGHWINDEWKTEIL
ncbi:unnamed protein product [Coffea canephora]|uniref:DH200=94 genomic scaffold, scaffold_509 n=1 Tax=Coffea canephora TaxID=49390 RepID=A0A068VFH1_COFCA|nr:unnamed protein product [Coffea canephora]